MTQDDEHERPPPEERRPGAGASAPGSGPRAGRAPDALEQEFELDHSPSRIWAALTEGRLLSRWLLPCDPGKDGGRGGGRGVEPGASFSFAMPGSEGGEGRIDCEVVEVEPGRRVAYTWRTHRDRDPRPAEAVDALVTFALVPLPDGRTRLRIRQVGIPALARGAPAMPCAAPWGRRPVPVARPRRPVATASLRLAA